MEFSNVIHFCIFTDNADLLYQCLVIKNLSVCPALQPSQAANFYIDYRGCSIGTQSCRQIIGRVSLRSDDVRIPFSVEDSTRYL